MTDKFHGTLSSLIACYQADPISPYQKLRFRTRENYTSVCRRLRRDRGTVAISSIKYRDLLAWHQEWSAGGKIAMAHSLMGMLRTLIGFGAAILESEQCARVGVVLHQMKFQQGGARTSHLSAEQAEAIRSMAHANGLHSIALAQAFQFDCMLRQKDVIGEWVPRSEPVKSDIDSPRLGKWLRGLRWEEIDAGYVLSHVTSKRLKMIEVPLLEAPMVMEELSRLGTRPSRGPIIVSEVTAFPYQAHEFRRQWRKLARACGIPDNVFNMDTRSGAISEATDAGADLEHVRHAATHSDIAMTQRYSRNSADKIAGVMKKRAAHRKGSTTKAPEPVRLLPHHAEVAE